MKARVQKYRWFHTLRVGRPRKPPRLMTLDPVNAEANVEQKDACVLNRIEVFPAKVEGREPVVVVTLYVDAVETESEIATVIISLDQLSILDKALNATRSLLLSQFTNEGKPN